MGALDANGIWQYDGADEASPVPALLNRLADSTSDAIGALAMAQTTGLATKAAAQSGIGTAMTDLTDLAVTVTVVANRKTRVSFEANSHGAGATDVMVWAIREGSTSLREFLLPVNSCSTANTTFSATGFTVLVGLPAGTHTIKLSCARVIGAGAITIEAPATGLAQLLVEDAGPV